MSTLEQEDSELRAHHLKVYRQITDSKIQALRELLPFFTPGERVHYFNNLLQDYCVLCGEKTNDCNCHNTENDE